MTKEITKAFILQQIEDKFKLRELVPQKFTFGEEVCPVYNIEDHLKEFIANYKEHSITATGAHVFFTVPPSQRWRLNRYDVVFMAAGAYTVAGLYVSRAIYGPLKSVYVDLTAGQTTSYHITPPIPIALHSGDAIGINIDGYTSTANLRLYIDYDMEEVR